MLPHPTFERISVGDITFHSDPALVSCGVVFGFSERGGGVSKTPYDSLNLGTHVDDSLQNVEENRRRFLRALSIYADTDEVSRLFVPEQLHTDHITVVDDLTSIGDLKSTDALVTSLRLHALLLCFADCVPVVLVAPGPAIAVVHAGWRGALKSLPGKTALVLAKRANCAPGDINAYIGPHICHQHYITSAEILGDFKLRFGNACDVGENHLNLEEAVRISLGEAGVQEKRICTPELCTAEHTDRFFSYRAEGGVTGRHGAAAFIR